MSTKPVTGAFGSSTASAAFTALPGYFNISISGTWVGTTTLQRSFNQGTTWLAVTSYTNTAANAEALIHEPESGVQYRFSCVYTSGSCVYRISQ